MNSNENEDILGVAVWQGQEEHTFLGFSSRNLSSHSEYSRKTPLWCWQEKWKSPCEHSYKI